MISVLVADDHEKMREVISAILRGYADVRLVAEASSYREVVDRSSELHPDVVLMDIHMRDEQKVFPSDLKSCLADCQLLAMSVWTDQETKHLAKSFGAVALLDKANLASELLPSLKQCVQIPRAKAASSS
jgi:DNA-binding NarL/FixJ family response regulator